MNGDELERVLGAKTKQFKLASCVVETVIGKDIEKIVLVSALSGLTQFQDTPKQYGFALGLLTQLLQDNKIALLRKDIYDTQK